MFFHILKKDLQRKRIMNVILLIFIIMAAMFLAGSVGNLVTVSGAVDYFMELSKVPDYLIVNATDDKEDAIAEFIADCPEVKEYQVVDAYNLPDEQVTIKSRAAASEKTEYERTGTLVVCPVPKDFLKVFTMEEEPLTLKDGEIALPRVEAEENHLAVGDVLSIEVGDVTQEFTVKEIVKDAAFGSTMMGFKRFYITESDFEKFGRQDNLYITRLYCVNYRDEEAFLRDYKGMQFSVVSNVEKSTLKMVYIMDMLVSAVLIVVSICLILIAFLLLRFTIVFTLQEDYREIGIMKAIGIPDGGIKSIYLVKYLAVSVIGALLGFFLSFPFGDALLRRTIVNIVAGHATQNIWIHIVCAVAVVLVVIFFCYGSTNRLKKFSVMEAIRNGSNGERYRAKSRISLHDRTRMKPYFYMACNDITGNMKRFLLLGVIFFIGTQLILLPLSAVNTLQSAELVRSFSLVPSDVYIGNGKEDSYVVGGGRDLLESDLEEIKETVEKEGWTVSVRAEAGYVIPMYADDPEDLYSYYTLQQVGDAPGEDYDVLEGRDPTLPNEVMVTETTAEKMGVAIGDSVYYKLPQGTEEFVITGIYQSMINMGDGLRLSRTADLGDGTLAGVFSIQVDIEELDAEDACEILRSLYPDDKVMDAKGYIRNMLGSTINQMETLQTFITVLVLLINSLITALMVKTFITKERGEIAMLKSIGFGNRTIRSWQAARILLILVAAILIGAASSKLLSPVVIGPIFAMMGGTQMELITEPLQAYVIYPFLLLLVTGITAYLGAGEIRRVDCKEINNLE